MSAFAWDVSTFNSLSTLCLRSYTYVVFKANRLTIDVMLHNIDQTV
ncbi:Protein of unknown function [Pyronema omphalodes CBS 100304]|uniref:Uncharacterized protein n=1 Tax=Pyronema omphalodes (strain CBS 100304) TaxID=1076935 RepID=U4LTN4_PYROM|nr:Protein of unknown function [Pyronema omphalodes CBS 100304]